MGGWGEILKAGEFAPVLWATVGCVAIYGVAVGGGVLDAPQPDATI
jgi:hypothetical protein